MEIIVVTEWTIANGSGHYKRISGLLRLVDKNKVFVFTDLPDSVISQVFPLSDSITLGRNLNDLKIFLSKIEPHLPVLVDLRSISTEIVDVLNRMQRIFYYDCAKTVPNQRGFIIDPNGYDITPKPSSEILRIFAFDCAFCDPRFFHIKEFSKKNSSDILVSFGSTDPFNLTSKIIPFLEKIKEKKFFVVLPSTWQKVSLSLSSNIEFVKYQKDLLDLMRKTYLVVSSFGTTTREALAAGKRVLIINPTIWHKKASRLFRSLGIPAIDLNRLNVDSLNKSFDIVEKVSTEVWENLRSYIREAPLKTLNLIKNFSLDIKEDNICPLCGAKRIKIISCLTDAILEKCFYCGSVIKKSFLEKKVSSVKLFSSVYKKRYGKTYLQDRERIEKFNKERLIVIKKLLNKKSSLSLLDCGCALGFFLNNAREEGFDVKGIEKVKSAVNWAYKNLKIKIIRGDLNDIKYLKKHFKPESFDVITLWYVIEHLPSPLLIIEELSKLLKKGGILALSTTNANGFSFRFNRRLWAFTRPSDHFFDFTVSGISNLFKRYGLKHIKTVWRGIYFSRFKIAFPVLDFLPDKGFFTGLFDKICRFFGYGDTFEAYFRKVRR